MSETITVTQLNTRVKAVLTGAKDVNDIWVIGEISNLKLYPSGHYYFSLKDAGSEVRAVMFRPSRARIGFEPQDHAKVTAYGHVDMYVERGSYQFIVETMSQSGEGDLYQKYEALKRKLEAEGLFAQSRQGGLPVCP
jgi:exodeoxyribonuclease VII large subunit